MSAGAGNRGEGAANNGMHPTADTPAVIYFQSRGAAGDAGRYVAVVTVTKENVE